VAPRYFETIGTRLVAGRGFTERDDPSAPRVAIVNEHLARRYWSSADNALGRRFRTSTRADAPWIEIVGVARDGKYLFLGEEPMPYIFFPLDQRYPGLATVLLRTDQDPETLITAVRKEVRVLDATLPIYGVKTMPQFLSRTYSTFELGAAMVGTFAFVALLLAGAGLCGLMHFAVTRRTREIGVRVALGADTSDVLRAVLSRSMTWTAAGLVAGIGVSTLVTRFMQSLLLGVTPYDSVTMLGVAVVTMLVALLAAAWPARRAAAVHPMDTLRHD
jgi:predicted permease